MLKEIKKHHLGLVLLSAVVFLVIGLLAGSQFHYPYKVSPKPPLPKNQIVPNCNQSRHVMGQCLPRPKVIHRAGEVLPGAADPLYGLDLSNNDPINGLGNWRAIHGVHNQFVFFKVNEGTGFIDRTAASMAHSAWAAGMDVGGYDFIHLCGNSPGAEADVFSYWLRQDGLLGTHTLPPVADVEYGGGCNARAWLSSWLSRVYKDTGRVPLIYTGAWFWNPHFGSWWPANTLAWISGYNVHYPYMPAGRSELDIWQDSDAGWNGVTHADHNIWERSTAAYAAIIHGGVLVKPRLKCFGPKAKLSNKACQAIRPLVSKWSHADNATLKALTQIRPELLKIQATVNTLNHRDAWFKKQISAALAKY